MSSVPASQEEEVELANSLPTKRMRGISVKERRSMVDERPLSSEEISRVLKQEEQEPDFEKLRHFAKTIEKTEMRFSQ